MKKKRGDKKFRIFNVQVHLTNRWLYTFIALGILAIVAIGVWAYGGGLGSPSVLGHTMNETAPPSPCSANQFLKWDGSKWVCASAIAPSDIKYTSTKHDGLFTNIGDAGYNGYRGIYNWIQSNGCSGYHVCTSTELVRWKEMGKFVGGNCWYNSGVTDYYYEAGNLNRMRDCEGWSTNSASTYLGLRWFLGASGEFGTAVYCSAQLNVCCCK